MNRPCVVIAGTQSGVGKTSITLGLIAALTRRGLRVQPFKTGPDYLDPTYLAQAAGRPCLNLDGWMMGESYIRQSFAQATEDADIAVVEGVMGLFDGADAAGLSGSTAEIAKWLGAPVLLVANAHGAARSFAAMVHGYTTFEPSLRVAGVIANRCGGKRHLEILDTALSAAGLPALLGGVPRASLPALPSRHLGLVTADPRVFPKDTIDQLADAVESSLDLERVVELSRTADASAWGSTSAPEKRNTIARLGLARDEAFHFYYPDNLAALEREGCELVPFSPLRDTELPDGLDGIYLGGGYPEEHAATLSANATMLASIRAFANSGRLIYAECGGLMTLCKSITTPDGATHRMAGLLALRIHMLPQRKTLGYAEVTTTRPTPWGPPGTLLRGHEFHYSEMTEEPTCARAYQVRHRRADASVAEGYQSKNLLASYVHLHFASQPEAVRQFVNHLAKTRP